MHTNFMSREFRYFRMGVTVHSGHTRKITKIKNKAFSYAKNRLSGVAATLCRYCIGP